MEFDIYGVFKDVLDENVTNKLGLLSDIETNGKNVETPFDYVNLFSHDAWNVNSYTEACQNICNNCVRTNERFLKFTNADILACLKVEDSSQLPGTEWQNNKSRRVYFSTGVSISVDSDFYHKNFEQMEFETDLEEFIVCDDDITRGVPYPHTGEDENKIESAFYEDIRTVGYGRADKFNCLTYNNPFDPRITFQGLGPKTPQEDGRKCEEQSHTGNAFLAVGNLDYVLDNYFNGYRNNLRNMCESSITFTSRTIEKCITRHPGEDVKRKDLKIDDGGSLECKKLFEKIRSDPVREIWTKSDDSVQRNAAVPTSQKSSETKNQTNASAEVNNQPTTIEVKSATLNRPTDSYKHTEPDPNKDGKKDKVNISDLNEGNEPAGYLGHMPKDKATTPSTSHSLGWNVDCWSKPISVTKNSHNGKQLRRAASESLTTETLRGKMDNVRSRTSHCADDGSLRIPLLSVPDWKQKPSDDKEIMGIHIGNYSAKPKSGDVKKIHDLQNWADILFKNKTLQKNESILIDKDKGLDKMTAEKRPICETPEESTNRATKIPDLTLTESISAELKQQSRSDESKLETNPRALVSKSEKTERNTVKTTTPVTTQMTSHQSTPNIKNAVPEIRTIQHSASHTVGVHQIPTILTSGHQRGGHYTGYQESPQYWASRSIFPTNFAGYHNYSGVSAYHPQTVRQPPPGFSILGANRIQQNSRPSVQVNYPTPLLATTATKRMYATPEVSRPRYPPAQQFLNCFASYPPYYQSSGHLSHNYNVRTGWTVNMNNNNNNNNNNSNDNGDNYINNINNSNNDNQNIEFDNSSYFYGDGHHESVDYSVDMLGFDTQHCNTDFPLTYQSSVESYQDSNVHVRSRSRSRPLRSNLIRIFPSKN